MKSNVAVAVMLLVGISGGVAPLSAQEADGARQTTNVRAAVSLTNKGISTVPSLTLGKPAAIFDVVIGGKDLSFEPQFRFGLDGKPWSFLFWGRYKLLETEKLRVNVGAHPAFSFRAVPGVGESDPETIVVRRYLAAELSPTYSISPDLNVGTYNLYSYGVDRAVTRHTNLFAVRANATTSLPGDYFLRVSPQVYYLRMDDRDGYYVYSGFTVGRRGTPISISAVVNKVVETTILGGEDLLWNVSVNLPLH